LLKKVFDFFIFTSLFIACCAVLMVWQASFLFDISFPFPLYLFVFSGSVCSYNFHWFLTPPQVQAFSVKAKWNFSNKMLHLLLSVIGLTGAAIASVFLIDNWLWLCLTALLTFLYSAPMITHPFFIHLRKIAVGKTVYLAFAWTHITAILPFVIANDGFGEAQIGYAGNRFFFIYAICIVFDRRDRESDRRAGIKSLITSLDENGVDRLFWLSLLLSLVTAFPLLKWISISEVAALVIPGLILLFLYPKSKGSRSDYLYYFLLDGLMALSATILILLSFAR
jgi:4-hydroxybenzoate polyprenyltransferase